MATERERAEAFWRQHLLELVQPGNPRAFAHGIDRAKFQQRSPLSQAPMGMSFQTGRMPNEVEIKKYIESKIGPRPTYRPPAGTKGSSKRAGIKQPQRRTDSANALTMMAALTQLGTEAANAANEARYAEGHGELSGLRDQRQALMEGLGQAQAQLNEERARESLANQTASLAASGIGNSNVLPAFQQRSDRDLRLVQQKLAEDIARERAATLAQDTNNLVGFVERREDVQPDTRMLMDLAMRMGQNTPTQASASSGNRGTGGRGSAAPRRSIPVVPGPQGGMRGMTSLSLGNLGVPSWAMGSVFGRIPSYRPPQQSTPNGSPASNPSAGWNAEMERIMAQATEAGRRNSRGFDAALRDEARKDRIAAARQRNMNRQTRQANIQAGDQFLKDIGLL